MSLNEFKKLLCDKLPQFFSAAARVHNSEMYCETVHSVEKLADASFRLFVEKPWDEQTKVLVRTTALSKKINETIERESPLVVALALLASIRVHEQLVNGTSN